MVSIERVVMNIDYLRNLTPEQIDRQPLVKLHHPFHIRYVCISHALHGRVVAFLHSYGIDISEYVILVIYGGGSVGVAALDEECLECPFCFESWSREEEGVTEIPQLHAFLLKQHLRDGL